MGTDRDWEQWGAHDPYFGVYSREEYRAGALTNEAKAAFFTSGETHIRRIWRDIEAAFGSGFEPRSALDFGCGVGRLVLPLAQRASLVTGVDVSPSMLAEAKRNCSVADVANVVFIESDDNLSRVTDMFDLVHSYIVLQHIPWRRGRGILQALAARVAPGGVLAVQILSACTAPRLIRWMVQLRYALPPLNWARNLLRGRPLFEPAMQLHVYDLAAVKSDLERGGFVCSQVDEPFAGFRSTLVYAKRKA